VVARQSYRREDLTGYSGPLPPPQMLAEYDDVIDNGAERIFTWVSGQTIHRQRNETKVINAGIVMEIAGLVVATGIVGAVLWFAWVFANKGHNLTAFATVIVALASLAGVFVYARKTGKDERIEKAKIMAGKDPEARA